MKSDPIYSRGNNLSALLQEDSLSRLRYEHIRRQRRVHVTTVYDISTSCNLKCEGCLFFASDGSHQGGDVAPVEKFAALFREEQSRGVTYPVFAGAEPALNQDVLRAAAHVWSHGMIHTNGIIRIDDEIPFRLLVSIWGGVEITTRWRGADVYKKVFENIAGDPRVLLNYTITRPGIAEMEDVVADCAAAGLRITFQIFSPTSDYPGHVTGNVEKLQSSPDNSLLLSAEDDLRALAAVEHLLYKYPDTVVYSLSFARWLFGVQQHFRCDSNGFAENCPVSCDRRHRHYQSSLDEELTKSCGHNAIACSSCRAYTATYPLFLSRTAHQARSKEEWREWIEVRDLYGRIYYPEWDLNKTPYYAI